MGGKDGKIVRCIELSSNELKHTTAIFGCETLKISCQSGNISNDGIKSNNKLLELFYYQHGKLKITRDLSAIDDYSMIQKYMTDNLQSRCSDADIICTENKIKYLTTTASQYSEYFNLKSDAINHEIEISETIYNCAIYRSNLYLFIKKYFDPDLYKKINCLMLSIINIPGIQHFIREKELAPSDLLNVSDFTWKILNNRVRYQFLLRNLGISRVMSLNRNDTDIIIIKNLMKSYW